MMSYYYISIRMTKIKKTLTLLSVRMRATRISYIVAGMHSGVKHLLFPLSFLYSFSNYDWAHCRHSVIFVEWMNSGGEINDSLLPCFSITVMINHGVTASGWPFE